ncbi:hypothetical protein D9619_006758 [Psilocybe cf. subviscida]|uniref:BTB domain-containing protein n=1 Tax=Psilocybe cf. subviscida TaxID=2480587 RepID=A0A8H5B4S1_9AGAR|nr:hypothetical protein D9619_006758 [Psilocybe cf. subviscida]
MGAFPHEQASAVEPNGLTTCKFEESANLLENVFQFIYPKKHNFPAKMSIEVLLAVAEAIEKYEVFSGKALSEIHLSAAIDKHPLKVLDFSLKYNYEALIDKSSKPCLALRLSESITAIPPSLVQKWIQYHENWRHIFGNARLDRSTCQQCASEPVDPLQLEETYNALHKRLRESHKYRCGHSTEASQRDCCSKILSKIDAMQPFSAFIKVPELSLVNGKWVFARMRQW